MILNTFCTLTHPTHRVFMAKGNGSLLPRELLCFLFTSKDNYDDIIKSRSKSRHREAFFRHDHYHDNEQGAQIINGIFETKNIYML